MHVNEKMSNDRIIGAYNCDEKNKSSKQIHYKSSLIMHVIKYYHLHIKLV